MTMLLSLDASSQYCSVSLISDESATHLAELQPRRHAQRMLPMVDEILRDAGVSKQALAGIAYGRGPGSFTGIRIAASLVQGISMGLNLPVFGYSSLQLVAIRAALQGGMETGTKRVAAVMDAHMGEVFWGCFEADDLGVMRLMGEEHVGAPEACVANIASFGGFVAGSGVGLLGDEFAHSTERLLEDCPPLSEHSVELVREAWRNGAFTGFEAHGPVYLRDSVAWKKLDQQPSLLKR